MAEAKKNMLSVVCLSGNHFFQIRPGSEAEAVHAGHEWLSQEQCPVCKEERRELLRSLMRTCECYDAECTDGCAYAVELTTIPADIGGLVHL